MVRSDPVPTGIGAIAALDAVAKPNANAAPRTIVLIINRSFFLFLQIPSPLADSKADWREATDRT